MRPVMISLGFRGAAPGAAKPFSVTHNGTTGTALFTVYSPDLVAHRTGGNWGQAVSEADEDDPDNLLVLVNDDYEEPINLLGRDLDSVAAALPDGQGAVVDDPQNGDVRRE